MEDSLLARELKQNLVGDPVPDRTGVSHGGGEGLAHQQHLGVYVVDPELYPELARVDRLAGGMSASARPARARLRAACARAWRKRWFWAE